MIKTELYFGQNYTPPDLGDRCWVSDKQVQDFLLDIVSPRFPGFTVLQGQGYWKGEPEDSFIVVILRERNRKNNDTIEDIVNYYKRTYYQDSVLRIDYEVDATL